MPTPPVPNTPKRLPVVVRKGTGERLIIDARLRELRSEATAEPIPFETALDLFDFVTKYTEPIKEEFSAADYSEAIFRPMIAELRKAGTIIIAAERLAHTAPKIGVN